MSNNPCDNCVFGKLDINEAPCNICWAANSQQIKASECKYHHTAKTSGYVGINNPGIIEPYKGRYGVGYTIRKHNPNSTRYCLKEYYIKEEQK